MALLLVRKRLMRIDDGRVVVRSKSSNLSWNAEVLNERITAVGRQYCGPNIPCF